MKDTKYYIDKMSDMPAMPNVIIRALNIIKDENTGVKELADIMSYDQALATEVLRLVNSAYYGFSQQITSINKALPLLGMMQAKNIIVAVAMKPMLTSQGGKEMWKHSIRTAVGCELLAQQMNIVDSNEAFVIGFLHDIGKLALNINSNPAYKRVKEVVAKGANIIEAEDLFLGANHATLGAMLAKKWQLPVMLSNCIKYHHQPGSSMMSNIVYMVYAVDRLVQDELPTPVFEYNVWKNSNINIEDPNALRETIFQKSDLLLAQLSGN